MNIELDEVVVTGSSTPAYGPQRQVDFTIWGLGTDTSGRTGTTTHSINHNDIGGFSAGGAPSSNAFVRFLEYIKDLLSFSNDLNDLHKPNESTMEKKVEKEAKNVPKKIKVVLSKVSSVTTYTYYETQVKAHKTKTDTLIFRKDSANVIRKNDSANKSRIQRAEKLYNKTGKYYHQY